MSRHAVVDIREDIRLPAALMPDYLLVEVNEPNLTVTLPPAAEVMRSRLAQTVTVVNAEGIVGTRVVVPHETLAIMVEQVQQRMTYAVGSDGFWRSLPVEPGDLQAPRVNARTNVRVGALRVGEIAAGREDIPRHDHRIRRVLLQVLTGLKRHLLAVLVVGVRSAGSDWSRER